ncbi:MAG: lipid-transfer protein [Chloroflexi bacterium]|nr:lipid-transfer protein [Chloroflexota bacterium]
MTETITPADHNAIRDRAAIVGIGETEFSWDSGKSELQLASEAIKNACDDAGISPHDIDGMVRYDSDNNTETMLVQALGIKTLRHWESIAFGGGAGNATVGHAAAAIAAGYCNYAVCFRAGNLRSNVRLGQARGPERIPGGSRSFLVPWGAMAPAHNFGMFVRRYMHQYGATSRDFGWVAVTLRHHASRNPRALRRKPITIEDHQRSRMVADPLRLLDFCQENDGAAAIVMTTPERARDLRHSKTLVLVEAAAQGSGPSIDGVVFRPDLAVAESAHTARDLWSRARLTAKDMDAFMFYDHFTPFCLLGLEAYGFVPFGEARDFVQGGDNIRFDGILPTNTHGGNHSEAYIHGLTHPQEAVRLIRGTSTAQPPKKQINRVLSCSSTAQLSAAVIIRRG